VCLLPQKVAKEVCIQDVQIGQRTRHTVRSFTVGTTPQKLLNHNPLRFALLFGNPSTGTIWVSPDSGVVVGRGHSIQNTMQAPWWNITIHGDVVMDELWAVATAAGTLFNLTEVEFAGL
jgi:hypothetical protein